MRQEERTYELMNQASNVIWKKIKKHKNARNSDVKKVLYECMKELNKKCKFGHDKI